MPFQLSSATPGKQVYSSKKNIQSPVWKHVPKHRKVEWSLKIMTPNNYPLNDGTLLKIEKRPGKKMAWKKSQFNQHYRTKHIVQNHQIAGPSSNLLSPSNLAGVLIAGPNFSRTFFVSQINIQLKHLFETTKRYLEVICCSSTRLCSCSGIIIKYCRNVTCSTTGEWLHAALNPDGNYGKIETLLKIKYLSYRATLQVMVSISIHSCSKILSRANAADPALEASQNPQVTASFQNSEIATGHTPLHTHHQQ